MLARIPILLGIWALIEIALLVELAERTSLSFTLLYLLTSALVGMVLVMRQMRLLLVRSEHRRRRQPSVLAIVAGVLLIVPGILSDVLALLLLTPPGGRWVRGWFNRRVGIWSDRPDRRWDPWSPAARGSDSIDEKTIDVTPREARVP